MIELNNIHTILDNKVVHDGLNLKIETGETKVVIGGSGVGKSVLIKVINKLITPQSGEVLIDNKNIFKMNEKEFSKIRQKMSVLFQGAALFDSMNVMENIAFPLRRFTKKGEEEIKDIVIDKLKMVGLSNIEYKFPSELSGGMAKRVGLARAIVTNPEYIFYDEPTTGIDPVMGGVINDLIIRMKEQLDVTSIVVTHDMNSAFAVGDKIAMMYDGKIIFEGTPYEIKECENIHIRNFINGDAEEIPDKLELL
jgi:phospholipid/cholesterol/gamma-HCH transport system ATP-binding protein